MEALTHGKLMKVYLAAQLVGHGNVSPGKASSVAERFTHAELDRIIRHVVQKIPARTRLTLVK